MAIDLGSSNTTRYYSVPDHADFTLPNGDWAWVTLVYPQDIAATKYIVSTGAYGGANSFNLIVYSNTGIGVKVDALTEVAATTTFTLDKWHWLYATRRSGNLYTGIIPVGGSSVSESTGSVISASYNSATGPNIGRRTDGASDRYWKGRFGQVAFVSGSGITAAQAAELAKGASLLSMPFAANIKFLLHGRNANNATITDLVNGHVATKQGTSYGTGEEDIQTPYIWTPEYIRAASVASGDTVGSSSGAATVSGVGASIVESTGSSSGSATVSGVGDSTSASGSTGSAAGSSTVNGVGASSAATSGTVNGVSTVTGIGASVAASTGSASGSATVSGVGDSSIPGSTVGTSTGTATVSGVGASVVSTTGTASGSATVTGVTESPDESQGGDDFPYVIVEEKKKKRTHRKIEEIFEDAVKEVLGKEPKKLALPVDTTKAPVLKELKKKEPVLAVSVDTSAPVESVVEEEAEKVAKLLAQYQEQVRLTEMEEDEELLMLIAMEML